MATSSFFDKELSITSRDALFSMVLRASFDHCSIEIDAIEHFFGEEIQAEGEIGIDQIIEIHKLLGEVIEAYQTMHGKI